ncbi:MULTISPECIES: hypothetical protein [unclassified Micromonospora]|uniref:hypothetical protein n=1 Tax=unclassified Micromonospora TaxID=2617518 RepID=UPI001C228CB8|nr:MULTISPECIES: hypothetical protein [unclassified Micromonospora]MBU8857321.1 hypothetical protein [Micromonospora sp. WMMB482]MDM4782944.1 hypothetical protein [Micromonospora sp. b486]
MTAVETGYAPPTPPGRPGSAGRRRLRWLTAAAVAWAVLLAGLTWWSVRTDAPTVKEQRSLDQAGPVVDRAIGELTAAVGAAGVPALLPDRLERGCRITPMDDGATLERGVEVAIGGDDVRGVLRGIADRLPPGWRAGVSTLDGEPLLRADAGEFVTVEGRAGGPGRLLLTADTGCRPTGSGYRAPSADAAAESAALASALGRWGGATGPVQVLAAPCPGGGTARTARSEAAVPADRPLAAAFGGGTAPVVDTADAYARPGDPAVLAQRAGQRVRVAVTTPCTA